MLRGLTGTPIRRMHLANSSLADAEPEPLMFANFTTKSLVAVMGFMPPPRVHFPLPLAGESARRTAPGEWGEVLRVFPHPPSAPSPASGGRESREMRARHSRGHLPLRWKRRITLAPPRIRFREQESSHVPCTGRTPLGAQAAMQAHILVLHHHAAGLDGFRHVQILFDVFRRCSQARAQIGFFTIGREGDAIHRTDIDRKSTRLNSSHPSISYAVFCLKKKKKKTKTTLNHKYVLRQTTEELIVWCSLFEDNELSSSTHSHFKQHVITVMNHTRFSTTIH